MDDQSSVSALPLLAPNAEEEIDARIRELRSDPQWSELYEGASEKLLRGFIRYDQIRYRKPTALPVTVPFRGGGPGLREAAPDFNQSDLHARKMVHTR
jgi:hypothetical protein